MSEQIAGWTFGGIWLMSALWAVLDSEARGRNPIVWGILTLFLGPFALGAYAITGDRATGRSLATRRRTYFFTVSFFFLGVTYASFVALLAVALDAGVARQPIDSEDARVATAILLALLVFALPLWTFHWIQALTSFKEHGSETDQRSLLLLFRRYASVVLIASGLVTLGFGVFLVFTLFAALLDVYEGGRDQFLPVLVFLPVTLLLMAYHWFAVFGAKEYRELASRFEDAAGAVPEAVAAEGTT